MSNNVELSKADRNLDALEALMIASEDVIDLPVKHSFTPGLYSREIFMPAGTMLTSKVHKTEHPYVILEGIVSVYIDGVGVEILASGHSGITKAGTRRALVIEEDCRWVTFHPLSAEEEEARKEGADEDDLLDLIENRIIEKRALTDSGKTTHELYKELLEGGQQCLG